MHKNPLWQKQQSNEMSSLNTYRKSRFYAIYTSHSSSSSLQAEWPNCQSAYVSVSFVQLYSVLHIISTWCNKFPPQKLHKNIRISHLLKIICPIGFTVNSSRPNKDFTMAIKQFHQKETIIINMYKYGTHGDAGLNVDQNLTYRHEINSCYSWDSWTNSKFLSWPEQRLLNSKTQ